MIGNLFAQEISFQMPEKATWQISITDKINVKESSNESLSLEKLPPSLKVIVTKDGEVYHFVFSKKVNGFDQFWKFSNRFYGKALDNKKFVRIPNGSFVGTNTSPSVDLPEFLWISKENFIEYKEIGNSVLQIHKVDNKKRKLSSREEQYINSLLQERNLINFSDSDDGTEKYTREDALEELGYSGVATAFVNPKTGIPILFKSSNLVVKLKSLPTQKLSPPPFIQKKIDFLQKRDKNKKNVE